MAIGHAGDTARLTNASHNSVKPAAANTRRLLEISRLTRSSAAMRARRAARRRSYSARGSSKERPRERHVVVGRLVQLGHRDVFVRGVREVNRSGAEQQRRAPSRKERNVGGVGK